MDQEELAAKRKMVESWLSSQAAGPSGAAAGGAAGADTIAAAGGAPAHARGRSGGAGDEVLAGSPAKLALMAAPDVALALGDEPGGKAAGKAGSTALTSAVSSASKRCEGAGWAQRHGFDGVGREPGGQRSSSQASADAPASKQNAKCYKCASHFRAAGVQGA